MSVKGILLLGLGGALIIFLGRGLLALLGNLALTRGWRQLPSVIMASRLLRRSLGIQYRVVSVTGSALSFAGNRCPPLFRVLVEYDHEVVALETNDTAKCFVQKSLLDAKYPYNDLNEINVSVRSLEQKRRAGSWYNLWN